MNQAVLYSDSESSFQKSLYFSMLANRFHNRVSDTIKDLCEQGKCGNVTVRVISPLVGVMTLVASVCLRVMSMLEPLMGMLANVAMAIALQRKDPLFLIKDRFVHLVRNMLICPIVMCLDVFRVGVVVGMGGVFAPKAAYHYLYVHGGAD